MGVGVLARPSCVDELFNDSPLLGTSASSFCIEAGAEP